MSAPIDMAHLRTWIGRRMVTTDVLTEDLARKYHATFDAAGDAPQAGSLAPRLIHFCLAQPTASTAALGQDGHPARGGFLPPIPLPQRMWAGGEVTFHGDLKVGDVATRTSLIEDVSLKEGRSGALCFVTVRHRIEVDGRLAIEERQDLVYRSSDGSARGRAPPSPREVGADHCAMRVGPALLFRYSALTFNSHRIHYDRPYATEVECYPGLVVHGPLQAALLFDYAAERRGVPPTQFSFRGVSPLFDQDAFSLHAREDGDSVKLWTAKADGPICMQAEAHW